MQRLRRHARHAARVWGKLVDPSGNSSGPPLAPLPEFIDVIVASDITESGSTISGNTLEVFVVKNDFGYAPDPGHAGTGTVVEIVCPAERPPS